MPRGFRGLGPHGWQQSCQGLREEGKLRFPTSLKGFAQGVRGNQQGSEAPFKKWGRWESFAFLPPPKTPGRSPAPPKGGPRATPCFTGCGCLGGQRPPPGKKGLQISQGGLGARGPTGHRLLKEQSAPFIRPYCLGEVQPIEYSLETYQRSNQDTSLTHKPIISEGSWVQSGDLLTDCSSSVGGELSLGQNILIAYMPWEGYNFEDAILISERLVVDDLYTSVHIERYDIETYETKLGFEEITRNIPDISKKEIENLDSFGIIKKGSFVEEGDILVGKVTPINKKNISPYQKLLYTILEKPIRPIRDSSLRAPKGIKAKVIDIKYFLRKNHNMSLVTTLEKAQPPLGVGGSEAPRPFVLKTGWGLGPPKPPRDPLGKKNQTPLRRPSPEAPNPPHSGHFLKSPFPPPKPPPKVGVGQSPRGLGGRGPHVTALLSGFMGVKLPQGQSPGCLGGISREASLPHPHQASCQGLREVEKRSFSSYLKAKPWGLGGISRGALLPQGQRGAGSKAPLTPGFAPPKGLRGRPRPPLFKGGGEARGWGSKAPHTPLGGGLGARGPTGSGAAGLGSKAPHKKVVLRGQQGGVFGQKGPGSEAPRLLKQQYEGVLEITPFFYEQKSKASFLKALKNIETIHIYLAEKRKIQVGDKMAGRHGNKGIVSQILPIQDMPYLPDGTPIDMVLNPLGVPSRMNVGQIYECLLGLAGKYLGEHYKVYSFDEIYGPEASRSFVFNKLYEARLKTKLDWLFNPNTPGKIRIYDGRTGESFDQCITIGQAYILRLVHMVDDKIHMRSTGPYSLVTQQPLRGRSKQGGQRLGEMEVWALEGYGAAFTLLEMLTIKSDDMTGRMTLWSNFILNKDISIGTPESFKVLVCELQALCLDIGLFRYNESSISKSNFIFNNRYNKDSQFAPSGLASRAVGEQSSP